MRIIAGLVLLVLAVVAAALLVLLGADRGVRLVLFAPFFAGAVGLLQARDHTCVMLAVRNQCEISHGIAAVTDSWLAGQLRRQARELLLEAAILAALLTGLVLLIPG